MVSHYRAFKLRLTYYSRVFRSAILKLLWYSCLPFFVLEKRLRSFPPKNGLRIFIIVVGGLGDCLLFDPLFRRIKEKWPKATIDVLTGFFGEMWQRIDSVDNVYYLKATKFKPPWRYVRLFRKIYLAQYDIVAEGIAMLPPRGIYPVLPLMIFKASQAPIRIGRKNFGLRLGMRIGIDGFRGSRDTGASAADPSIDRNPFITHTIQLSPPDERQYHESAKVFAPLKLDYHRKKNEPRLNGHSQQDAWSEKLIRQHWAAENDIVIGFCIETTRKIKSWPLDNFIALLEWGIRDNLKFVMIGAQKTPSDSPLKKFARNRLLNLSGMTTIGEMIAIIRQCQVFVSGDTGPAHIAQACRVPTVVLFGPSNEMEFGPVDHALHTLVLPPEAPQCRPCVLGPCIMGETCMNRIKPETVYAVLQEKVQMVLSSKKPAPSVEPHRPPTVLCEI